MLMNSEVLSRFRSIGMIDKRLEHFGWNNCPFAIGTLFDFKGGEGSANFKTWHVNSCVGLT